MLFLSIGGRDGLKTLNYVECYDPKTGEWTKLPPMLTHRHGVGVAVLDGPMYAIGGHDGWSYLNTVERSVKHMLSFSAEVILHLGKKEASVSLFSSQNWVALVCVSTL